MLNNVNFIHVFEELCQSSGLDYVEVYQHADITKQYYSKIKGNFYKNKGYFIPRNVAIALGLSLKLNLDDMQQLLSFAGYALSANIPYDQIVISAITKKNYNVVKLKIALQEAGLLT